MTPETGDFEDLEMRSRCPLDRFWFRRHVRNVVCRRRSADSWWFSIHFASPQVGEHRGRLVVCLAGSLGS